MRYNVFQMIYNSLKSWRFVAFLLTTGTGVSMNYLLASKVNPIKDGPLGVSSLIGEGDYAHHSFIIPGKLLFLYENWYTVFLSCMNF